MKKRTNEILSGVLVLSILMGSQNAMKAAAASGQEQAGGRQMTAVRTELWQNSRSGEKRAEEAETAETKTVEGKPVERKKTGIKAAGIEATGIEAAGIEATGIEAAEIEAAEIKAAGIEAVETEAAETEAAEIKAAETETTETKAKETNAEEIKETEGTETASESVPNDKSEPSTEEASEGPSECISETAAQAVSTQTSEQDPEWIPEGITEILAAVRPMERPGDRDADHRMDNALHDSDFYIELSSDGKVRQYTYGEWLEYLKSCKEWVDGEIEVKLSDSGKRYFDAIQMEVQEGGTGGGRKKYVFWAVSLDRGVSTKDAENGTRTYTAGRDQKAPVLKAFCADNACYEPTRTDTEQYFASDFILKGTYCDDVSGVCRIEYTADIRSKGDPVWIEVEDAQASAGSAADFEIALSDGCYPAIAVRARDAAGNISDVKAFVNDAGEYIKVVVDSAEPVLQFDISAGGQPYSGEEDNWTNRDVRIEVTADPLRFCSGICQCEYAYVKIGDEKLLDQKLRDHRQGGTQDKNQGETQDEDQDKAQDQGGTQDKEQDDMTQEPLKWTALSVQDTGTAGFTVTEDRNGYYLFRAVSRSGVATTADVRQRVLIQHQAAEARPILVSGADETKCRNGWYNQQSGTPQIRFEYPDYDTGAVSKEYDAPVTIHYELTKKDFVPDSLGSDPPVPDEPGGSPGMDGEEGTAVIGVMSCNDVTTRADGSQEFVLRKDDLSRHVVDPGSEDGFYTLGYWTTDRAGNVSEKQIYYYKIDCHAPTDLTMELAGSAFEVGSADTVTYREFYRDAVSGSADAQYGISGKGSLVIRKAKKIGEWKGMEQDGIESADNITISPNTRCFLYIRAEDAAGNITDGWTDGIVVDNMAPNEAADGSHKELFILPQGANEHGFFNDDVTVDIRIKDAPEDDNCAALRSVTGSIGRDGVDTIAGQELFSFTGDAPTEDEIIAASAFEGTQLVDAKANESNEAYIEVTASDRSGNTGTSTQFLKIDVTRPEIDIRFDNNDAVNGRYYRQGRTATIHVHELNFDPGAVRVLVTKDGQTSEAVLSDWKSDGSEHYASVALMEDGEYSITADCVDLADNASDPVHSGTFVIDRSVPQIAIALTAGQGEQTADRQYFNTGVTAVITVTERNFNTEDLVLNMTPALEKGIWSHDGDVHTLRVSFGRDDVYHIDCVCTDLAGNLADTAGRDFVIDTAAPVIHIDGVADGSANSGAVLPVISVSDLNIEASDIAVSVRTGIGDPVVCAVETALAGGEDGAEYRLTLTDMTGKADNIYYLTTSACDRAGNQAELTYRFSLNRNGSAYDLSALAHLMERQYNTYDALCDIQIMEMNIDTVDEFELYVSRNGAIGYEAEYTRERYGSADAGYTYVYQIAKENFAAEGIYRLTLYSRDRAGNEVNSAASIRGEEIQFVIDNTPPRVVIDGVESGKVYDVEAQEARIVITDNFKLDEAELTLVNRQNEVLERWDYMELCGEDEALKIVIGQRDEPVSLLYRVKDAAGNEMQTVQGERAAPADFLVTTDRYVQLVNDPPQGFAKRLMLLMAGMFCALALSAAALHVKRGGKILK